MRNGIPRACAVLFIVVLLGGASPGEAKCVAADVIVHRTNQPDQPVLTEGQCLVATPWTTSHLREWRDVNVPTVTGVPSGAYVEVVVPLP